MTRTGTFRTSLLFSVASALSATAQAQEGATITGEEIVVTAQGREQALQDVPVAVSVASGDLLEEQNIHTLQDLSERVGNVKITSGPQTYKINIRGVGSGENPGFEQAVATFADGIYRSRSRTTLSALFDVERVELLKGPQTTFFGANASAGALSITTRKPSKTLEYNAAALYGSDNEYNLEGGVGGPLGGTLTGRIAGRVSGMDGWVKVEGLGHGPNDDSQQGRVSLRWEPSSSWQTDFRFDIARSRVKNSVPLQLLHCPPPAGFPMSAVCGQILGGVPGPIDTKLDFRSDTVPSHLDFDFHEAALTNAYDLGPATLRLITGYSRMKVDSRVSLIPIAFPTTTAGWDPFPVEQVEKYRFFSQEARLESETGGMIEYILGAYYSHGKLDFGGPSGFFFLPFNGIAESVFQVDFPNFGGFDPADPASSFSGIPELHQKEDMYSGFGALTIRPADKLTIDVGARYTAVHKRAARSLTLGTSVNAEAGTFVAYPDDAILSPVLGFPITRSQAICFVLGCDLGDFADPKRTDSKSMPSASVQYDFAPELMAYAKYSKGFKAGGYSSTASANSFGPEQVDAYEAGFKSSLLNRALTLNITAFWMDYKGLQETTFDANLQSTISNVAAARSKGIEIGASLRASPWLGFNADIAYLDSKYRDFPDAECTKLDVVNTPPGTTCVADLSGKRRAFAPEWSGSIGANIEVPVGSSYRVQVNPTLIFSSWYYLQATADPLFRQDGYAKLDLRAGFGRQDDHWEIALIGRNLTDKKTSNFLFGVPGGDGSVTALVERGRSIAVQLSIRN